MQKKVEKKNETKNSKEYVGFNLMFKMRQRWKKKKNVKNYLLLTFYTSFDAVREKLKHVL